MKFTQYVRPHGTPIETSIELTPEMEANADALIDAGWQFSCEVLVSGMIALYGEKDFEDEEPFMDIELVANGPEVPDAVIKLINRCLKVTA